MSALGKNCKNGPKSSQLCELFLHEHKAPMKVQIKELKTFLGNLESTTLFCIMKFYKKKDNVLV